MAAAVHIQRITRGRATRRRASSWSYRKKHQETHPSPTKHSGENIASGHDTAAEHRTVVANGADADAEKGVRNKVLVGVGSRLDCEAAGSTLANVGDEGGGFDRLVVEAAANLEGEAPMSAQEKGKEEKEIEEEGKGHVEGRVSSEAGVDEVAETEEEPSVRSSTIVATMAGAAAAATVEQGTHVDAEDDMDLIVRMEAASRIQVRNACGR